MTELEYNLSQSLLFVLSSKTCTRAAHFAPIQKYRLYEQEHPYFRIQDYSHVRGSNTL